MHERRHARHQAERDDDDLVTGTKRETVGKRTLVLEEQPHDYAASPSQAASTSTSEVTHSTRSPTDGHHSSAHALSGAPATARATSSATTGASASIPSAAGAPDAGLVDPFMKANWNDAMFWALAQQHGLPGNAPPDVVGELDRWLAGFDLSSGERRIIHLAAAVMTGALDESLLRNLPGVGPVIGLVQDLQSVAERVAQYGAQGDRVGQGVTIVRALVSVMKSQASSAQDVVGPLATLMSKLNFAVTVAAGAATVGTGGAAAPVTVPLKGAITTINVITEVVSKAVDLGLLGLDAIDGVLMVVELGNAAVRAEEAETRGQFDRAAEYRSIMRGVGIEAGFASLRLVLDAGMFAFGLGELPIKTLAGLPLGFVVQPFADAAGGLIDGTGELAGLLNDTIGDELLGGLDHRGVTGMPTLQYADSLRSPIPMVSPPGHRTGEPALDAARAGTAAESIAAHQAAHADRPSWHQPLIDAIVATPAFAMTSGPDLLRPSWYLGEIAQALRQGVTSLSATTTDGIGVALDQIGAHLQPAFDLAVIGLNGFIAQELPKLQTMAAGVNQEIQKTQVDLDRARGLVAQVQGMTGIARGAAGVARGVAVGVRDQLLGVIDGATIDLPAVPGLDGVEATWNQAIGDLRAWVTRFSDAMIADVEAKVLGVIAALEARLAQLQAAIVAGGAVETQLQASHGELKELVDRATTAFAQWSPVIPRLDVTGTGTWLRNLSAQWRAGLEIEQGVRPDPWSTTITPAIAQPQVAAWKAKHGIDLERAFYPTMPAAELAACAQLAQRGLAASQRMAPGFGDVARASIAAAYDRVVEMAGAQGVNQLHELWRREDHLAWVVQGVELTAPSALPAPAEPGELLEQGQADGGERPQ
jgi:hypothetical protein